MESRHPPLFTPCTLGGGGAGLSHRIVLAPMTRNRATEPNLCPHQDTVDYYSQRASPGGLLITEATHISPEGCTFVSAPGIWTEEQREGWRRVVQAVHNRGGIIFLQLYHGGRISHPSWGEHPLLKRSGMPLPPVSSSAKVATNLQTGGAMTPIEVYTSDEPQPYVAPRELELHEMPRVIEDYRRAVQNCLMAGFDGVEVHAAHGYFIDQFIQNNTNERTDAYGCQSFENRCRLLFEVLEAAVGIMGPGRVACKLGPYVKYNGAASDDTDSIFAYAVEKLNEFPLAYLSFQEPIFAAPISESTKRRYRELYKGCMLGNGGYIPKTAAQAIVDGHYDLISFGRLFLSNPDLPERIRRGSQLNMYDRQTFYTPTIRGGCYEGYTDYPDLEGNFGTQGKYELISQDDLPLPPPGQRPKSVPEKEAEKKKPE
eukprot:gnl/TRDRNA2_/TRDRNA2_174986_c0_seq2.p1 gnl/TRDRNA2_/TRDRNA2_174986_c0~~gnl/TRDRNA2_/TRDRNA2_174986_c0_seq2.p1  ORF type:complete len:440 (+),score=48.37 gnl/TRDRNA2_/TRDRNA2_174986_c0_seq2:39-1322(+)